MSGWSLKEVTAPEPEAEEWAMMMLGLGLVGLVANRKKSNSVLSA